ncbi:TonB-dependent receptor plug domain-containing protein [Candidatus Symbiopectobacterium sp.]|uniref:TonB-dependent receptor plug domain-containing protein n=1 Tax=Candidatus Symbiopectobacterium sp. TaxID=2816440 RepID=UPI0025C1F617|nr:TonB-dependent receptor plug domain-containing protein [Candidatus Symbiopectobacterium sp.]
MKGKMFGCAQPVQARESVSSFFVLALCVGAALWPALAGAAPTSTAVGDNTHQSAAQSASSSGKKSGDTLVVTATGGAAGQDVPGDYSTKLTTAGTRLLLSPRDIPQSITIVNKQRMQDQNLQTVGDVLDNVVGITGNYTDSERTGYYAHGFYINKALLNKSEPVM